MKRTLRDVEAMGQAAGPTRWSIVAFALKFVVIYAMLAAGWPVGGRTYASFLQERGKLLFEIVGASDRVRIRELIPPSEHNETEILVRDSSVPDRRHPVEANSWHLGYLSTSILVALTLAIPLPWDRRLVALAGGTAAMHAFVLVRLCALVVLPSIPAQNTFWNRVWSVALTDIADGHGVSCFAPVLIWLVMTTPWRRKAG